MNDITQLEQRAGSAKAAYELLGISKAAWFRYRAGGEISAVVAASVRAHLALSNRAFSEIQKGNQAEAAQ